MKFRKSSFSGGSGGNCVELGRAEAQLGIRDSKNANGPVLTFPEERGRAFLVAVRAL
jgi:hypothetical protein